MEFLAVKVHVLGVGLYGSERLDTRRLEEVVYAAARAALDDAGIERSSLDSLTLAACDEMDGRPISSMLLSAPAGGLLTDEIKVTDSGLSALCLGSARIMSGEHHVGLVASWCKSSKTSVSDVMRFRTDPFFARPIGIDALVADALWAQAAVAAHGITSDEVNDRVAAAQNRAVSNPRGLRSRACTSEDVGKSAMLAVPVRTGQQAPLTDGAVALVLASDDYVQARGLKSLARVAGVGWCSDGYALGRKRLLSTRASDRAWGTALASAAIASPADLDVIELESPTGYHEAAFVRQLQVAEHVGVSPSGGTWAQNPFFCSGLVNAAEAVLQAAGRAGAVQVSDARWTAAHGVHGFAAQGSVVAVFDGAT